MALDFTTQLVFRHEVAPTIFHMRFKLIKPDQIEFVAGQYVLLGVGNGNYRQYSIASNNLERSNIDLIVKYYKGGLASEYFINCKIGDTVNFKGPAGIFIQRPVRRSIVYLATGTGIAPIISMIESSLKSNLATKMQYLFWGVRTLGDLYFSDRINYLAMNYPSFIPTLCLSQERNPDLPMGSVAGRIQQHIGPVLSELCMKSGCDVYICGNKLAVEDLKDFVLLKGVPRSQLFFERFN